MASARLLNMRIEYHISIILSLRLTLLVVGVRVILSLGVDRRKGRTLLAHLPTTIARSSKIIQNHFAFPTHRFPSNPNPNLNDRCISARLREGSHACGVFGNVPYPYADLRNGFQRQILSILVSKHHFVVRLVICSIPTTKTITPEVHPYLTMIPPFQVRARLLVPRRASQKRCSLSIFQQPADCNRRRHSPYR